MNKILFIENGMLDKKGSCSCHHDHHKHDCGSPIESITRSFQDEHGATYTIKLKDGRNFDFQVFNGKEGPIGPEGPEGVMGPQGFTGESIYDIAVRNGFEGDEQEFLAKIYEKVVTAKEDDEHYVIEDADENPYVKYVEQTLTKDEQEQARNNINAFDQDLAIVYEPVSIACQVFDDDNPSNVKYTPQTLTIAQQEQARQNIAVASEDRVFDLEEKMRVLDEQGITTVGDIRNLNEELKYIIESKPQSLLVVNALNVIYDMVTDIIDKVGDLNDLTTVDKTNVVAAINELSQLCYEDDDINFNDPIFPWT